MQKKNNKKFPAASSQGKERRCDKNTGSGIFRLFFPFIWDVSNDTLPCPVQFSAPTYPNIPSFPVFRGPQKRYEPSLWPQEEPPLPKKKNCKENLCEEDTVILSFLDFNLEADLGFFVELKVRTASALQKKKMMELETVFSLCFVGGNEVGRKCKREKPTLAGQIWFERTTPVLPNNYQIDSTSLVLCVGGRSERDAPADKSSAQPKNRHFFAFSPLKTGNIEFCTLSNIAKPLFSNFVVQGKALTCASEPCLIDADSSAQTICYFLYKNLRC